eukprot:2513862-Rhodomonas_salina.1
MLPVSSPDASQRSASTNYSSKTPPQSRHCHFRETVVSGQHADAALSDASTPESCAAQKAGGRGEVHSDISMEADSLGCASDAASEHLSSSSFNIRRAILANSTATRCALALPSCFGTTCAHTASLLLAGHPNQPRHPPPPRGVRRQQLPSQRSTRKTLWCTLRHAGSRSRACARLASAVRATRRRAACSTSLLAPRSSPPPPPPRARNAPALPLPRTNQ